jgi:N-acetyl-gamma-glutamyl-phosphate reductase
MRILLAVMGSRVAIIGASGFAGGELVRLVDDHPSLDVLYLGAGTSAGRRLGELHPHLTGGERVLGASHAEAIPEVDVAFLALPHGASAEVGATLAATGIIVVDLGSDFRLRDNSRYREAYGAKHSHPEELGRWVYGLPEIFGDAISSSGRIAVPGCYPTAAVLAMAPLLASGMVSSTNLVIDALSGTSGAGRAARDDLTFAAVDEGVRAYGVTTHRHRHEMEQALGDVTDAEPTIVFTPHLVPMQRGILATCYGQAGPGVVADDLVAALSDAYGAAPFVEVIEDPPQTRWVVGSNRCLLAAFVDVHTSTAIVLAAIDNLIKGAAGNAVQCANLALGLEESAGLPASGWMP